jgi:hypothetical protein
MEKSGLDLYFIDRNGENFKASLVYAPYFYIDTKARSGRSGGSGVGDSGEGGHNMELMQHLQKRFENCRVEMVQLEDLDMPNHLSGKTHQFIKISFGTVAELMDCKNILRSLSSPPLLTHLADHMSSPMPKQARIWKVSRQVLFSPLLEHVKRPLTIPWLAFLT